VRESVCVTLDERDCVRLLLGVAAWLGVRLGDLLEVSVLEGVRVTVGE
jgi:hypothetical protein